MPIDISFLKAIPYQDVFLGDLTIIEGCTEKNGTLYITLTPHPDIEAIQTLIRKTCANNQPIQFILTQNRSQKTIPQIQAHKIIYVMSAKGGVGKSTLAAGLALALAKNGKKVGLLDADIYGPSTPTLFGICETPDVINQKIIPLKKNNVSLMSIAFLLSSQGALTWRGLMVQKALKQMLFSVDWTYHAKGDLDVLIIDTPPGTGDVHLTLHQNISNKTYAFVVTTPSQIVWADVIRGLDMLDKMNIQTLGIVENTLNVSTKTKQQEENQNIVLKLPLFPDLPHICDEGSLYQSDWLDQLSPLLSIVEKINLSNVGIS